MVVFNGKVIALDVNFKSKQLTQNIYPRFQDSQYELKVLFAEVVKRKSAFTGLQFFSPYN